MLFDMKQYRQAQYPVWLLKKTRSEAEQEQEELREIKTHNLEPKYLKWLVFWLSIVFMACLIDSCSQTPAHAYTDQESIQTIVGEASNQGYKGMVCVGEVIRHNSSLRGFYGLHASHSLKESAKTWAMAKQAWFASKNTNFTHNADHFENIHAFGTPYWVKNCVLTFEWKDHRFFREIK